MVRVLIHQTATPSLFELWSTASSWHNDAASLLELVPGESDADADLAAGRAVFGRLSAANTDELPYPDYFAVEAETSAFLYATVRRIQPQVMLETGVANGLSTAVILAAMDANGRGELHSTDISPDVGALVENRSRWHLHVVSVDRLEEDLAALRAHLPRIDIFLHDGDHRFRPQTLEYRCFWPALPPGGLLLSDDIDFSYAFHDFAHEIDREPAVLLDTLKLFGMFVR